MSSVSQSSSPRPESKLESIPEAATSNLPAAPAPRRYLALWLPFLPADRLRRRSHAQDERPLVLVEKQRGSLRIAALDQTALQQGLRPGMTLAQARALTPDLAVADFAPAEDARALAACAEALTRFTPLAAVDGAQGVLLDITGCAHLFGGEAALLKAAQGLLTRFGLLARAAIASTPQAAHAFARFKPGTLTPPGGEAAAAHTLPIAALEPEAETATALARAGLRTLGDLAERPSPALTARFGAALTTQLQLICGHEDRRITPLRPPPEIMAERHFPEPLALMDALLAVLERLAGDIAQALEKRGEGGRAFEALLFRADGAVRRIFIETAQPLREPAGMIRLLRLKIEALADPLDPGFGFDAIRLGVLRSESLNLRQADMQADMAGGKDVVQEAELLAGLIDRLAARFGRENVLRFILRDSHDPSRAGAMMPCLSDAAAACATSSLAPDSGDLPARPLTLFPQPHLVEAIAEAPDGPPIRFRWRRMVHEITRAEGPERIAPEWWRSGETASQQPWPQTRDYFRVEDREGHRFWLFREGEYGDASRPPRWFLHGLFA